MIIIIIKMWTLNQNPGYILSLPSLPQRGENSNHMTIKVARKVKKQQNIACHVITILFHGHDELL